MTSGIGLLACLCLGGMPLEAQEPEWIARVDPVMQLLGAGGILGMNGAQLNRRFELSRLSAGGFTFPFADVGLGQVGLEPIPHDPAAPPSDTARVARILIEIPTGEYDPLGLIFRINTLLQEEPNCYQTYRDELFERIALWKSRVMFVVRTVERDGGTAPHSIGLAAGLFSPLRAAPMSCSRMAGPG